MKNAQAADMILSKCNIRVTSAHANVTRPNSTYGQTLALFNLMAGSHTKTTIFWLIPNPMYVKYSIKIIFKFNRIFL